MTQLWNTVRGRVLCLAPGDESRDACLRIKIAGVTASKRCVLLVAEHWKLAGC